MISFGTSSTIPTSSDQRWSTHNMPFPCRTYRITAQMKTSFFWDTDKFKEQLATTQQTSCLITQGPNLEPLKATDLSSGSYFYMHGKTEPLMNPLQTEFFFTTGCLHSPPSIYIFLCLLSIQILFRCVETPGSSCRLIRLWNLQWNCWV